MGPRFESVKAHQNEALSVREQAHSEPRRQKSSLREAKREGVFCEVVSSVPSRRARSVTRPVGQAVKTAASHAANMGSIPVRVTTYSFLKERVSRKNFMLSHVRTEKVLDSGAKI